MHENMLPADRFPVEQIGKDRDAAIAKMEEAIRLFQEAERTSLEADGILRRASFNHTHFEQRQEESRNLASVRERRIDPDGVRSAWKHYVDASIWRGVFAITGLMDLMDEQEKKKHRASLEKEAFPATADVIYSTIEGLIGEAPDIFKRGVARCFAGLDRRFRSHDVFKIKDRVILPRFLDDSGWINTYSTAHDHLVDIERAFAKLEGEAPQPGELRQAIMDSRKGYGPRQGEVETRYFLVRTFKNGNAHLWFRRKDLVEKVNKVLAAYYGEVVPDAAPKGEGLSTSTAVSKDLQFYRTPKPVVKNVLDEIANIGSGYKVLEPSAGDGAFAHELLRRGCFVTAIEVDAGRCNALFERTPIELRKNLNAWTRNFLDMDPLPEYDVVIMNPPFYGTHWIDHVVQAHKWLRPGGVLYAVLPSSAEIGTSGRHKKFHAWLAEKTKDRGGWPRTWTDLPEESFAESGTNIATVVLRV